MIGGETSRESIWRAAFDSLRAATGADGGRVCLIEGAAGMGKTHLLQRLRGEAPEGVRCVLLHAPSGEAPPLLPFAWALRDLWKGSPRWIRLKGAVMDALRSMLSDDSLMKRGGRPLLAGYDALQFPSDFHRCLPPESYQIVRMADLFRRVAASKGLALLCDDVQDYDATSKNLLFRLLSDLEDLPLFIALAVRVRGGCDLPVPQLVPELARVEPFRVVSFRLEPLDDGEVERMAGELLSGDVRFGAGDRAWLRQSSEGSPLFLRRLLEELESEGDLVCSGGVWALVRPAERALSAESREYFLNEPFRRAFARGAEGEALSRIVRLGAVAGRRFEARLAAEAAGLDPQTGVLLLGRLARETRGKVLELGEGVFELDHELTREVLLREFVGGLEPLHHRLLAEALLRLGDGSPERVAGHFERAGEWLPAAARYGEAARSELARGMTTSSAELALRQDEMLARSGLEEGEPGRLAGLEGWAQAKLRAGFFQEVADRLRPLAAQGRLAREPGLLRHLGVAASNLPSDEEHRAGLDWLLRARDAVDEEAEPDLAAEIFLDLAFARDGLSAPIESLEAFRTASKLAARAVNPELRVRLRRLTCMFGPPERVEKQTRLALREAQHEGLRFEEAFCWNNLGSVALYLRQPEQARDVLSKSLQLLRALGGFWIDYPLNNLAVLEILQGRWSEANELLSEALPWVQEAGCGLFIRNNRAVVRGHLGHEEEALEELFEVAAQADRMGDLFYRSTSRHNLARALLERGRAEEALRELVACPPHHYALDDGLIRGRRAKLLLEIMEALGQAPDERLLREARVIAVSRQPQAWIYRLPWAYCDVQFW